MIDGELTTCLFHNGSQLNFITLANTIKRGLNIMSLKCLAEESGGALPPIESLGEALLNPRGS